MKHGAISAVILGLVSVGVIGCNNKKSAGIPKSESVADISPAPAPVSTYQPTATPVAAQPVVYDTMQTTGTGGTAMGGGAAMTGGSYTVKKGDTLYSIARSHYGDGKQWNRIVAANPGLRPESLKVGQKITVP